MVITYLPISMTEDIDQAMLLESIKLGCRSVKLPLMNSKDWDAAALQRLSECLSASKDLQRIEVFCAPMQTHHYKCIADVLLQCPSLQSLVFRSCVFRKPGCDQLAEALRGCSSSWELRSMLQEFHQIDCRSDGDVG